MFPLAIDGFAGVTAIDARTGGVTVNPVRPVTPPALALIWELPGPAPVARPPALMVATALVDDAQVAEPVRSTDDPSL